MTGKTASFITLMNSVWPVVKETTYCVLIDALEKLKSAHLG